MMRAVAAAIMPLMLAAAAPAASTYTIDTAHSDVTARVAVMGVSSRTARFPHISGTVRLPGGQADRMSLDVAIDARTLTAADESIRKRLKGQQYFWVEKYPTIRFTSTSLTLSGARSGIISGRLTARGVTKPVKLTVTFDKPPASLKPGETLTIDGQTKINRRHFGMTAHSVVVGKHVTIKLKARLKPA
ncbi:YceI family protein [Pontixanthobacter aquaemixtae]|uniref:Polyisoprenoid-binding protein n=1 Tax=Pontixanthobacter aquaemixtae TaxID=1958940 RepID=A0A844ZVE9_9SPHN|nr:YceI family protein [Pontixanthobacter aquaemixtae]MXO90926.1 polyisoprenoid-binding protein [Pontixanthobacter aquaemixtae]